MDRLRAAMWRLRGARLGPKCRLGAHCVIDRPWGLETGERCQFEHEVFIKLSDDAASIRIGSEVFLGRGVEMDIVTELIVGDHALFAPGCFITDHAHRYEVGARIASQGCEAGRVRIGADVWVGANAVILPGVSIGEGAIVGAGAVVTSDVAPMSIVAGVPARQIGMRT